MLSRIALCWLRDSIKDAHQGASDEKVELGYRGSRGYIWILREKNNNAELMGFKILSEKIILLNCAMRGEQASISRGLPPIILASPDLFQETALFQIVYEAVVVDLLGFSSDGCAAFVGDLDGIGDGFTGDDHGSVEDFPGVHVVSGL